MFLTAPKLQMNCLKNKNTSYKLSGLCINCDANASCRLHYDCTGKMGLEFDDRVEEASSQEIYHNFFHSYHVQDVAIGFLKEEC